jgi:hypothetical protein
LALPPAFGRLRETGFFRLATTGKTPFYSRAALPNTLRVFL